MSEYSRIVNPAFTLPVVVHIPHSSVTVPRLWREQILLDDDDLELELRRMTDLYTDELFLHVMRCGGAAVVADWSRLVLDVERFEDDDVEMMTSRGMGVIYTHDSFGRRFRRLTSAGEREALLSTLYRPHHRLFESVIERALCEFGRCLVIDGHSFPAVPLPYELDQSHDRPDICIGTDRCHTCPADIDTVRQVCRRLNLSTAIDRPFSGAIVPPRHFGDSRVASIMIEVNRGLYMNAYTGERSERFEQTRQSVMNIVEELCESMLPEKVRSRSCLEIRS